MNYAYVDQSQGRLQLKRYVKQAVLDIEKHLGHILRTRLDYDSPRIRRMVLAVLAAELEGPWGERVFVEHDAEGNPRPR